MKKLYLSLLCAAVLNLGAAAVHAEDDKTMPPPPAHKEHRLDKKDMKNMREKMENKLSDELKLTDEQKTKAKELRKASREKIKPLMDEMKTLREKMDTIRNENMKAFEELLTPEQKEAFEKIKADRKAKFDKMQKKPHRPMPPLPME